MKFKSIFLFMSLCFTTNLFSQVLVDDVIGIQTSWDTKCVNQTSLPVTPVLVDKTISHYSVLWQECTEGNAVYTIKITPKNKTTPPLPTFASSFSLIKNNTVYVSDPTQVSASGSQATFANYFVVTWGKKDFTIKFLKEGDSNLYDITVTKCCRIVTTPDPTLKTGLVVKNYPNPTNGMVNLQYDLQESDHVNIAIYDNYNRLVKQLVKNESQYAGEQLLQFDTYDLSEGIYYIRVQTSKDVTTKPMILSRK
jgi:hypothetical protein